MSEQSPESELVGNLPGSGVGELSSDLPATLQFKRGRPSRKKIKLMIAAAKSPAVTAGSDSGLAAADPGPTVQTLFGTASILNPDIQVELADAIEHEKSSSHYFLKLFHFVDQVADKPAAYQGMVSPAALTALGVAKEGLKSFVRKKHGYAVYFCNLDIESESLCINQWQQQLASKPDFESFVLRFMDAAGLDRDLLNHVMPSSALASFELLIGTKQFWLELKFFLEQTLKTVNATLPSNELHAALAKHGKALAQCLMVEFIRRSTHLKSFKFKSTLLERRLDGFMLEMRTMKDLACKSKSVWLLNCWGSYAALYQANQCSTRPITFAPQNTITRARFFN